MNGDISKLAYVAISFDNVKKDAYVDNSLLRKLEVPDNNGRKIFATSVMPQKGETPIDKELWVAPSIFPTGNGGIEIATFTEFSSQDRHRHDRATEIYTVLKGHLTFYINDREIPALHEGDEIVILPGTTHQVRKSSYSLKKKDNFELIVRVHSISCYGEDDKYVQLEPDGQWQRWNTLSSLQRSNAYKL
ncbi:MAG: cupin domain-containing protein [Chitinispirillaceae bacterium]|nr:cupin domain-containing protein [Chitinispirillaceae bacterium]